MKYILFVGDVPVSERVDKATISERIGRLTPGTLYRVFQECTEDLPTPYDHSGARQRLRQMDELSGKINWTKFSFQMDKEMRDDHEQWIRLMNSQTEFETKCGF